MKIIDFHTHIYPEKIAEKATQSICDFYNLETSFVGNADTLIKNGRGAGIEKFVILPVAVKAEHVQNINGFVASQVQQHEEFIGFGTIHAESGNLLDVLEEIENLGLRGIKLHPDTQCFAVDDKRLFEIYDAMQGRLPLLVHAGDPRYEYSRPEKIKRILHLFPKLVVIAAHFGGWSLFDVAYENLKDENCCFDISSSIMFMGKEKAKYYINKYGADRMLFGSDFPLWSPEKEAEVFFSLGLSHEDEEKIAYKNAERLLGI